MNTNSSSNKTTQDRTKIQRKMDQLILFIIKFEFLKISIYLETSFAADILLAERQ
jgi:hypothetical protein